MVAVVPSTFVSETRKRSLQAWAFLQVDDRAGFRPVAQVERPFLVPHFPDRLARHRHQRRRNIRLAKGAETILGSGADIEGCPRFKGAGAPLLMVFSTRCAMRYA